MAHGFDRFWVIFTPFVTFSGLKYSSILGNFGPKSMAIAHGFLIDLGHLQFKQ
jgi:hypothetical protein